MGASMSSSMPHGEHAAAQLAEDGHLLQLGPLAELQGLHKRQYYRQHLHISDKDQRQRHSLMQQIRRESLQIKGKLRPFMERAPSIFRAKSARLTELVQHAERKRNAKGRRKALPGKQRRRRHRRRKRESTVGASAASRVGRVGSSVLTEAHPLARHSHACTPDEMSQLRQYISGVKEDSLGPQEELLKPERHVTFDDVAADSEAATVAKQTEMESALQQAMAERDLLFAMAKARKEKREEKAQRKAQRKARKAEQRVSRAAGDVGGGSAGPERERGEEGAGGWVGSPHSREASSASQSSSPEDMFYFNGIPMTFDGTGNNVLKVAKEAVPPAELRRRRDLASLLTRLQELGEGSDDCMNTQLSQAQAHTDKMNKKSQANTHTYTHAEESGGVLGRVTTVKPATWTTTAGAPAAVDSRRRGEFKGEPPEMQKVLTQLEQQKMERERDQIEEEMSNLVREERDTLSRAAEMKDQELATRASMRIESLLMKLASQKAGIEQALAAHHKQVEEGRAVAVQGMRLSVAETQLLQMMRQARTSLSVPAPISVAAESSPGNHSHAGGSAHPTAGSPQLSLPVEVDELLRPSRPHAFHFHVRDTGVGIQSHRYLGAMRALSGATRTPRSPGGRSKKKRGGSSRRKSVHYDI